VAAAVGIVVAIVQFQDYLFTKQSDTFTVVGVNYTPIISALLLVIVIAIVSRIYWTVAKFLNDFQNHRTETDYEDSLVSTIFVVQFALNFFYPTFVAFAKPFTEYQCVGQNCMLELSQVLLVLTFLPIIFHCIEQVVIMKLFQVQKIKKETSDIEPGSSVGVIERQYILAEYNVVDGTFQDYAALMALFGYTSMFVAAFPNGIAIALVSCEARMRIDGWRLCQAFRRPQPKKAEDIGVWENVMNVLSIIAVVYTYAIICFTAEYLKDVTWSYRWIYFLVLEHVTLFIKIYLIIAIEDVPSDVTMQLARQDHIVSKVIDNESDETEDLYRSQQAEFNIAELGISAYDRDYHIPLPPYEKEVSEDTVALYKLIESQNIFDFEKED
jgi:anoctamin-10/anoctamin-7